MIVDSLLIFYLKGALMVIDIVHPNHVGTVLGDLVKRWWHINPDAIRALEKFNRENNNVLLAEPVEKQRMLALIKLKAFKGTATGQRIDLSEFKQVFEPISYGASVQKGAQADKAGSKCL